MKDNKTGGLLHQLLKLLGAFALSWLLVIFVFSAAFGEDGEALPQKYNLPIVLIAIVIAFAVTLIIDFNAISRLKSSIQKTKADIASVNETANALIDKAERVADKYRNDEAEVYKDFAAARGGSKKIRSSKDFKAVMEAYPELQSNVHTQKLLSQIETAENAKLNSRLNYTNAVAQYNAKIHSFPVVCLRGICKWEDYELEAAAAAAEELVTDEELGI